MTNEADKFWKAVEKDLARQAGFAPLTPQEAQKEFDELPDTKLPDAEIDSIMEQVTSGPVPEMLRLGVRANRVARVSMSVYSPTTQ